ncbi:MAG: helix-turn-helix transcriptional regulator [Symploca sp. SIO2E6]|nr:helix-turn-helix transcriptional regulator [Symploca sp. SIO2E6]
MCKIDDHHLRQIIDRICGNLDLNSLDRRRAVNRLLIELERLPGRLQSSDPYYLEALDKTWEWVSKSICTFQQRPHLSLEESLVKWINGYLAWRIRDLYLKQNPQYTKEISLDTPTNPSAENSSTLLEQLSETNLGPPTLTGLDGYLEANRTKIIQEIFARFEDYVEKDPEGILRNCYPRNCHQCHCQLLCQRLLFQETPVKVSQLARNLGVNHQTLRYHWKAKCLPLLQRILERLGYSQDE